MLEKKPNSTSCVPVTCCGVLCRLDNRHYEKGFDLKKIVFAYSVLTLVPRHAPWAAMAQSL